MIGTQRGLTQVTDAEGGVRTAALSGPLLIIPRIAPQLTRAVAAMPGLGSGGEAEQLGALIEEFIRDVGVKVVAIGTEATTGTIELLQDGAVVAHWAWTELDKVEIADKNIALCGEPGRLVLPGEMDGISAPVLARLLMDMRRKALMGLPVRLAHIPDRT